MVKRSSLAQNLIKQLNNRIKDLEFKLEARDKEMGDASIKDSVASNRGNESGQKSRASEFSNVSNR